MVNGRVVDQRMVGSDGGFSFGRVCLNEGMNRISAQATDAAHNTGQAAKDLPVVVVRSAVRRLHRLRLVGPRPVTHGDPLGIEARGTDPSNGLDFAWVQVTSEVSDPRGLRMPLLEARPRSGVFRGSLKVTGSTDARRCELSARQNGERIAAAAARDPSVRDEVLYADRAPPTAPEIWSPTHPSACQDGFEPTARRLERWEGIDGVFGGRLVTSDQGSDSHLQVWAQHQARRTHWGMRYCGRSFDPTRFPIVSFDYAIRPEGGGGIDLLFKLKWYGWQSIALADPKPYFKHTARFLGARADGLWHHAELNLGGVIQRRYPSQKGLEVTEIAFMDLDDAGFMRREYGGKGGDDYLAYCIDNFRVTRYSESPDVTFEWNAQDMSSGIYFCRLQSAGYSEVRKMILLK